MEDFRTLCYEHRASHTGGLKVSDLEGCQNPIKVLTFSLPYLRKEEELEKKDARREKGL